MRIEQVSLSSVYVFVILLCVCASVSCARQPRWYPALLNSQSSTPAANQSIGAPATPINDTVININEASAEQLEKLPGIGAKLAADIVAHRERYGRFRRVEHLLMVRGISESRLRQMRGLITVE